MTLLTFHLKNIQKTDNFLGIHGDASRFDLKELEKIGEVKMIKKEEVIQF